MVRNMKGRRWKRPWNRRVGRPGTWWAPSLDDASSTATSANSCWSEFVQSVGSSFDVTDNSVFIPILWNLKQNEDDDSLAALPAGVDPTPFLHRPMEEAWTIDRIVGELVLEANAPDSGVGEETITLVHMGVVAEEATRDGFPKRSPQRNADCLQPWLWLHHQLITLANPQEGGTGNSAADFYGVPSAVNIPIDIRVKRRIEPEMVINLWLDLDTPLPRQTDEVLVASFLRCHIRKTRA